VRDRPSTWDGVERRAVPQPIPVDVQTLPAWMRAAVFLGVPSVIAMFLVYVVTIQLSTGMTHVEQVLAENQIAIRRLIEMMAARQADADNVRDHFDADVERIDRSLRALCVAAIHTDEQRQMCFQP
jgi:hypothetical protein